MIILPPSVQAIILLPFQFGSYEWYEFVSTWAPLCTPTMKVDVEPKALVVSTTEWDDLMQGDGGIPVVPCYRLSAPDLLRTPAQDYELPMPATECSFDSAPRYAGLYRRMGQVPASLAIAAPDFIEPDEERGAYRIFVPPPRPSSTPASPGDPIAILNSDEIVARAARGGPPVPAPAPIGTASVDPLDTTPDCTPPANYRNALASATSARARRGLAEYYPMFVEACAGTALPPSLLAAIAWRESRFNPAAEGPETSHGRALGMFQIMPRTAEAWNVDPLDATAAARAVALAMDRYMRDARRDHPSDLEALIYANSAYGQGVGNLRRRGLRPDDRCRALFLRRIAETFERLERTTS